MKQDKITSGNETFTKTSYNGVEVLVRDSNGYVNASKMADGYANKKPHVSNFLNDADFTETIEILFETLVEENVVKRPASVDGMKQVLMGGFKNDVRGTYVHPKLVHFVAEWVDKRYAIKAARIMDAINVGDKETLMKMVNELQLDKEEKQRENERLRRELEGLEMDLEEKDGDIDDLKNDVDVVMDERDRLAEKARKLKKEKKVAVAEEDIAVAEKEELEEEIHDKSVRSDTVNVMLVRIMQLDENYFGLTCDQCRKPRIGGTVHTEFWFPAGLNIRKDVRLHFGKKGSVPIFTKEELPALIAYIKSLHPL